MSPAIALGIPPNMPTSMEPRQQNSELLVQLLQLLQSHQMTATTQAASEPSTTTPTPEQAPTTSPLGPTLPQTGTLHALVIFSILYVHNIETLYIMLACFFGYMRAGEIMVPSDSAYDSGAHLDYDDINNS